MSAAQVRAAVESAFRDYATAGVPASGDHEPVKSEIRNALGSLLEGVLSSIGAGIGRYATRALLYADTDEADGALAYVYADATPAYNAVYQWDDTGNAWAVASWYFDAVAGVVQPLVDDAEAARDEAEAARDTLTSGKVLWPAGHSAVLDRFYTLSMSNVDPTKFYRVKQFFHRDVGTRGRLTILQSDDAADTNAVELFDWNVDPSTQVGIQKLTVAATTGDGVLEAVIDFGAPDSFSLYSGATTYANAAIPFGSALPAPQVNDIIEAAAVLEEARDTGVFDPQVRSAHLRDMVKQFWLYNAIEGHQYHVSNVDYFATGGLGGGPYARIYVRDTTANVPVLRYLVTAPSAMTREEFTAWANANVKYILLTDEVSGQLGYYAHAVMNWDVLLTLPYGNNFTDSYALGGIAADRVYTDGQIADYLQSDHFHERFTVGAGGDFADLPAATAALCTPDQGGSTAVSSTRSARAHYHNRIALDLIDTPGADQYADYLQTYWQCPMFVEVRGQGRTRTRLRRAALVGGAADDHAVTEFHFDHKVFDLQIYSETNPQYPLHSDAVNAFCDTFNGVDQRRRLRQKFVRMDLYMAPAHAGVGFGCGISSGQTIWFVDCKAWHLNTEIAFGPSTRPAAFFFHNTGPTVGNPAIPSSPLPAWVIMDNCASMGDSPHAVYISTLAPAGLCNLVLNGCEFSMIEHDTAGSGEVVTDLARDRVQWVISGTHAGPIKYRDLDGAWVLQTTAGVTVAGDAAPLIFGTVDDLGRGEKWIKNGTANSIGARLGAGKTLTIGAQSINLAADQSARTNAAILADINAVLTANPVSEVDIALERYPDVGFTSRVRNVSGVTIPKGRFVKKTGRGRVALAQPGDEIYGWTYRALRNNTDGEVITTKRIAYEYIEAATEDGGAWGLAADGLLSFAAATKLGSVFGGIVTRP